MKLIEIVDNLMLAVVPESLALLVFGISLIVFTVGLRWIFNRNIDSNKANVDVNRLVE
jgi:hypothetical protein